jgi:hypothetical protein
LSRTTYLAKSSNDCISYCRCAASLVGAPAQMDCPWCGCGWLFVCSTCGKPFTFATAVEVDEPLKQIALRDLTRRDGQGPEQADVADWVDVMSILLKEVEPGREYVYLDGFFLPADTESVNFEGWHARHTLPHLPHAQFRHDPRRLNETIGSKAYWDGRRLPGG